MFIRSSLTACCLLVLILVGATPASATADTGSQDVERLGCGQERTLPDENGTLYLRFQCLPDRGVVNWDFRLSLAVRAIVTGPVTERGLEWWKNGHPQSRNSGHLEPADYRFHGTMNPVFVGDVIDYQDFFRFVVDYRGQPGVGRVVFAGSLHLTL